MRYSDDLIEEIRMKNDIVDVISGYVKLQRKGSSYFGLCPFHNEKSPSFSVSPGKQMYYCFGCGAGGNVFTFLMEYENFTFPEALEMLADRAGVELPKMEYSKEAKEQADLKSALLEINKEAAKFYYYQLRQKTGEQGMAYLKGRELSDETINKFGLGYSGKFSNNLYQYLKGKNYSDELLRQSGLFNVDEKRGMYDKFWNRVIYPIMDVNNRVIGFGGRVMGDAKPKYLNSPETKIFDKSRNLYGLNMARSSRKKNLIICEGYMDVISMHQAGFNNAVASLGTALTSQQASLLKRYTDEVLIIYDSDEAGVKAALREQAEEREFQYLSRYASHSRESKGRARVEEECDIRTVYQRDRDRIIHSKAFRRLKDKTQVFLAAQGDHYRTRLTHTLEVSQTARTIAKALELNEDLVEAIALGHDLGHTPFGHAGEAALNEICPEGFAHFKQSVRVVERLEKNGEGLNLTWEVRDGMLNHRTSGTPHTLEGQVVRLCDKISYIHHDMDDAQRAGIFQEDDIPITIRVTLGDSCKERLNTLIHDTIRNSYGKDKVEMTPEIAEAMRELRTLMFRSVYNNPVAKKEERKARTMLQEMYLYYSRHPEQMSREYQKLIAEGENRERVVCDYISGMTDQYAMAKFKEIFIPSAWAVY